MSENKFRNIMGEIIDEHLEEILDDGEDHAEEIDKILNDFRSSNLEKKRKKTSGIFKKVGMVAAIVLVIFVSSVFLAEVPVVRAFRVNVENFFDKLTSSNATIDETGTIIKDYASFDEAKSEMGFLPFTFDWIPEGYSLNNIQAITSNYDDQAIYSYDFFNADKSPIGYISVSISPHLEGNSTSNSDYNTARNEFYIEQINGNQVAFSNEVPLMARFIYNNVYEVTISSDLDKENLVKLIENIKI